MWKSKIIKFAYGFNSCLNNLGANNIKFICTAKYKCKNLMMWLFAQDNLVSIKVRGMPMTLYANTDDTIAYLIRPFEPYTTELFERAIKSGSKVLDIGAQFGYFSLIAAKQAGQKGRVYAFEPAPANFRLLDRNIQMNGYGDVIYAFQKGVGNKHTTETLFLYENSDSHGMFPQTSSSIKETIPIECVTIDEFLGDADVDVIKMDIEGNEPYALEGMEKTILKNKSIILFVEFAPTLLRRAGVNPEDYLTQLERLGLDLQIIDEHSHLLKSISRDLLDEIDPSWYANLYCTKNR